MAFRSLFACRTLSVSVFALFLSLLPGTVSGQPTMKKYTDDVQLCNGVSGTPQDKRGLVQFCQLAAQYNPTNADAQEVRNDLIELVRGQIDDYYRGHKNGKRSNMQWLQMLFDVLEIGTSTTIDFIKGERAKTVLASLLTGFKGGRTAFNKNFEALQIQVLINKMNADRDRVYARIIRNKEKPVDKYRWLDAKNELRDYLAAGTFGNAMDSLVEATSVDATNAGAELIRAKLNAGITLAPSAAQYKAAMEIDSLLYEIESTWEDAETKRVAAEAQIVAADAKIAEANAAVPADTTKRDEWTAKKVAAVAQKASAKDIQDKSLSRVKKIYKVAAEDAEIKVLLPKISVKYAAFKPNIDAKQVLIAAGTANFVDYLYLLQKLNGVVLDEISKDPAVVERVKNVLEGSK